MKKLLSISLALLLIAALMVPAFAADAPLLADDAGLLSDAQANTVSVRLKEVSDKLDFDVVIVTTDNLEGKSLTDYADDYFSYNGYGRGSEEDGVLLLVYMNNANGTTQRWIATHGYGITAFTDYGIEYVGKENLKPLMEEGDWEGAFLKFADLSEELVNSARDGHPLDVGSKRNILLGIVISLVVGLVVGFIVMNAVKKKYKPVHFKANATDYLVGGSLQVTGASDNFRTTAVTRTPIQSNAGKGGSSTHTSSSGSTFGGGGF